MGMQGWRLVAGVAAAAIVGACGNATPPSPQASSSTATSPSAAQAPASAAPSTQQPPPPASDEDQIKAAVKAFQDAANSQNWSAYTAAMCPAMQAKFTGPVMEKVRQNRANTGITSVIVTAVTINGQTAQAAIDSTNELIGENQATMTLARGVDGWKICM